MEAPNPGPLTDNLGGFDYSPRTRVIFGENVADQVGGWVRELGGNRVLLVSDAGVAKAGHVARVRGSIEAAGAHVTVFTDAEENPTTRCVSKCAAAAKAARIDFLIGLGGGSSMDTAKGCNFVFTNGGEMKDYWGFGKAARPMLPLIAIPTTSGTGSECQSYALISDAETHRKMACGDPKAAAKIAILDPTLTVSQPARVTACTGIDALAHAVESAVTKKRSAVSLLFSREAFRACSAGFPQVVTSPTNLKARGLMLVGAAWAGMAIENSMLGAAHSAANPLTARHDIVHGLAVGLMLPHVIRFNSENPAAEETYAGLGVMAGLATECAASSGSLLADYVTDLLRTAGLPTRLAECGLRSEQLPPLAAAAAKEWTAQFNPRPVNSEDFLALYRSAL